MRKRDKFTSGRTIQRKAATAPKRWRTYLLMSACGLTLVSGFFLAGRQHFSSMDYGMRNSKLRRQVDELEAEKRRLMLAREVSLSPAELKKAAKKTGITDPAASGVVAQLSSVTRDKAIPATVAPDAKPLVIKTAAVTSAKPVVEKADIKPERADRPRRTTVAAE